MRMLKLAKAQLLAAQQLLKQRMPILQLLPLTPVVTQLQKCGEHIQTQLLRP